MDSTPLFCIAAFIGRIGFRSLASTLLAAGFRQGQQDKRTTLLWGQEHQVTELYMYKHRFPLPPNPLRIRSFIGEITHEV